MSPKVLYRTIARAEAVTWTLLILAMVLKYVVKVGDWPVSVAGFIHGFVFLSYIATALLVGMNQRWSKRLILTAAATSVIPYLTVPFDQWLERRNQLNGAWRTESTDHPRDNKWLDRTMRWLVARPIPTAIGLFIVVVAVFSALLVMGPPGSPS
ncbi:hypothetical protein AS038_02095 [Arthrobacter sp. NIO-1057]|nr:hypothetical protein AS038_02095 [Arthrobacter sp. NIO-1057]SCB82664.1 integral membrane protein [Arthrobacter sp. NIO-1057]